MNTINNYPTSSNIYNQNISKPSGTQTQNSSSATPTTSVAATQPTDSISISPEAQQAYQAINQSIVTSSAINGSVASVSGAASPSGTISTDWGRALDSMVSSGTITQGQKTSIENALNAEAQLKVNATSVTHTPQTSTNKTTPNTLINLLV